jgi:predicted O-methyltransferase YrrM
VSIPIFITCRDRLEPLKELVNFLERAGHERLFLIDNDSAHEPLLEYLATSPHRVIRMKHNGGSLVLWEADILGDLGVQGRFVLSDPDVVPITECPLDVVEYLGEVLDRYPDRVKAGLGLRIDDLPSHYRFKDQVITWESQFWERPLAPRLYDAAVATTLALYKGPKSAEFAPALRTGYPYLLRHWPWYVDESAVPEDESVFRSRAEGDRVNHWGRPELPARLAHAIAERERSGTAPRRARLDRVRSPRAADLLATTAWCAEPDLVDEVRHTPWAEHGWHAWNDMSPELEVCEFVASLVRVLRPKSVVETGVGQGFLTRRVVAELVGRTNQQLVCFESEPLWREMLSTLGIFDGVRCTLASTETPDPSLLAACDLCLLDSNEAFRLDEIKRWWEVAPPGGVLFVHDAGSPRGPSAGHETVHAFLRALAIPGMFLENPRGGFVGVKPVLATHHTAEQIAALEAELLAFRNSRTLRLTAPLRRVHAWAGRLRSSSVSGAHAAGNTVLLGRCRGQTDDLLRHDAQVTNGAPAFRRRQTSAGVEAKG